MTAPFGDPRLPARFWAKVREDESGCWLWTGCRSGRPQALYGHVTIARRCVKVHRHTYETLVGPIPPSLTIDHLCRVTECCNPEHLEPVTAAENIRRRFAGRTECAKGHPLAEPGECLTCKRIRTRRASKRYYDRTYVRTRVSA